MPDTCYSCGRAAALYECADGRYRCDGCRVAFSDGVRHKQAELIKLLATLSTDMHEVSRRPCPTCGELTHALGVDFGCYAYQARLAEQAKQDKLAAQEQAEEVAP